MAQVKRLLIVSLLSIPLSGCGLAGGRDVRAYNTCLIRSAGRGRVRGTAAGIRSRQLRFAGEFSHHRLQAAVAIRHGCEIAHLARTILGKRTKRNPGAYGGVLPSPYPGNRITELTGRRAGSQGVAPRKLFKPTGWRDTREGCRRSQQMPRLWAVRLCSTQRFPAEG